VQRRPHSRDDRPARERPATFAPQKMHLYDDRYGPSFLCRDVLTRVMTDLHVSDGQSYRVRNPPRYGKQPWISANRTFPSATHGFRCPGIKPSQVRHATFAVRGWNLPGCDKQPSITADRTFPGATRSLRSPRMERSRVRDAAFDQLGWNVPGCDTRPSLPANGRAPRSRPSARAPASTRVTSRRPWGAVLVSRPRIRSRT
jgi:hypothetical protein